MESEPLTEADAMRPRRPSVRMVVVAGLALAAVGAVSAKVAIDRGEDRVLAKADAIAVRESDLAALLEGVDGETRQRLLQDTASLAALVRRELGRRLLQERALAEGWDRREDVKARLERLRLDYVATSYLDAQSAPPPSFPSDAEVETAYQLNQQRFLVPRQFHLAQIYLRRPSDAAEQETARGGARAIAEDARRRPERFGDVAREKSHDTRSGPNGGDLGWLPEDQIQPAIRAVVIGMAAGEVSEAIETPDGWHILQMIETKPAAVAPLARVRDTVVAMLRQQRAQENAAAFISRLMGEKQAVVDEITLAKAQKDMR